MFEEVAKRILRAVFGGGADIDLSAKLNELILEYERLSSYTTFHRYGKRPSDFYYGHLYDIDTHWTNAGFINPAGAWLMAFSKKTWNYPALGFECIWPTLGQPNLIMGVGFESGGRGLINIAYLRIVIDQFFLTGKGAAGGTTNLRIDNFLPADYDSAVNRYGLKLNKCNIEAYIDDELVGILLFGLPEAIPTWQNNPPYTIGSMIPSIMSTRVPIAIHSEPTGAMPSYNLQVRWDDYQLVSNDGDPLPPRQYILYNENTATKWHGLAVAAGSVTSHPVPVWGYPTKTLYFQASGAGTLLVEVYKGGAWRTAKTVVIVANTLDIQVLEIETPITRCTFTPTAYPTTVNVAEFDLS